MYCKIKLIPMGVNRILGKSPPPFHAQKPLYIYTQLLCVIGMYTQTIHARVYFFKSIGYGYMCILYY